MAEWPKMAAGVMGFAFILDMFAISGGNGIRGENGAVEALEIVGFLCLMIGCVLALGGVFGDSRLRGNFAAQVAMTIFAFIAGLFIIVGLAVYGARVANNALPPYSTTLLVCAGALALVGGIFGALGLAKC